MERLTISSNDMAPLVQVVNLLCLAWILVSILGRGAMKLWIIRKLSSDDLFMIGCMVVSIGQTIAISFATQNGLGQLQSSVSHHQFSVAQKSIYAAKLLFVLDIVLAKLAVTTMLLSLAPFSYYRKATNLLQVITVLWGLSGIILLAVMCNGSQPWNWLQQSCLPWKPVAMYIAIMNLITELALILEPCFLIGGLMLKTEKKMKLLLGFACRIFAVAAIIVQIQFLNNDRTEDKLFSMWIDTILNAWSQASLGWMIYGVRHRELIAQAGRTSQEPVARTKRGSILDRMEISKAMIQLRSKYSHMMAKCERHDFL